jgi:hypothetical protein
MPRPGNSGQRGYGASHKATRASVAPLVATGGVTCWRCRRLIRAGQPWDLGHDDDDDTIYRGPEHVHCNRRAGAIKGNKMRGQQRARMKQGPIAITYTDPEW